MADALERKVANALSDEAAASHVLSELLLEVGAAIGEAERVGEEELEKAMDPALSPDPRKARAAMEDAIFAISRLRTLQPRLQQHYEHARYVEEHARWAESYEDPKSRRDGFVEELRDRFPRVALPPTMLWSIAFGKGICSSRGGRWSLICSQT